MVLHKYRIIKKEIVIIRDDVFKSYYKKLKSIINDYVVTKEVTESDPDRYKLYKMYQPQNKVVQLGYDKEKIKKLVATPLWTFTTEHGHARHTKRPLQTVNTAARKTCCS